MLASNGKNLLVIDDGNLTVLSKLLTPHRIICKATYLQQLGDIIVFDDDGLKMLTEDGKVQSVPGEFTAPSFLQYGAMKIGD